MTIDSDIQLWLETQGRAGQTVITPYVKSPRTERLQYRMDVMLNTAGGTSTIRQGGEVDAAPGRAIAMGQVALRYTKADTCRIRIRLQNGGELVGNYAFACPSP